MPDYRLLPESSGHDILEDMVDFWMWMGNHDGFQYAVNTATEDRFEPDLTRLLVVGESAGGYLAIQLALSHFNDTRLHIRALIAIYPMLGLRAPHWTEPYRKEIFDAPQFPVSMIDDHLERIKREIEQGRKPVKSCEPMEGLPRGALAIATVQHGRFLELLDPEHASNPEGTNGRKLHPEERILDDAFLQLPTSFFLHGTDDRAVPISGTDNFVNLLREKGYDEGRLLYRRPPGDHGFENDFSLYDEDADREWLKDGIEFVERKWNPQAR
jgi:acetyl esterase/lipase